jgi:hypothetical protein
VGEGKDIKEGCRWVNVVEIYVLMYENAKTRPVETVPGMGVGDKGEGRRVNSTMIYYKNFGKCYNVS